MGIVTRIVGVVWILSLCNGECVIVYSAPLSAVHYSCKTCCFAVFFSPDTVFADKATPTRTIIVVHKIVGYGSSFDNWNELSK